MSTKTLFILLANDLKIMIKIFENFIMGKTNKHSYLWNRIWPLTILILTIFHFVVYGQSAEDNYYLNYYINELELPTIEQPISAFEKESFLYEKVNVNIKMSTFYIYKCQNLIFCQDTNKYKKRENCELNTIANFDCERNDYKIVEESEIWQLKQIKSEIIPCNLIYDGLLVDSFPELLIQRTDTNYDLDNYYLFDMDGDSLPELIHLYGNYVDEYLDRNWHESKILDFLKIEIFEKTENKWNLSAKRKFSSGQLAAFESIRTLCLNGLEFPVLLLKFKISDNSDKLFQYKIIFLSK